MPRALLKSAVALGLMMIAAAAAAQTVGSLAQPLDGTRNATAETNLGNLVADAMRAAAEADFAVIQASALRPVTVPAGDLTEDTLRAILIFPEEPIVVLRLDAARIGEALERALALLPHPNKGFLQVSGLRVRFDPARAAGERVLSIASAGRNGPLEADKTYRVAMPESLAKGALGYFRVFNSAPRERTEITLLQALTRFAAANSPLSPSLERRLEPVG